ncbi:MAG TPA: adenosylcobinamide-GDP ribazoletransferase [Terriglobia bacterium]|jgi:adenosylcobinamide-GDP ribazoletransferase
MRAFLVGLQFLTRLPVRIKTPTAQNIADSYYFYPVIGFLTGLGAVLVHHAGALLFPSSFSIVLVLAFLVWITGGLHEDGLADVADGMGGGWTPEQRISIMKDSRIGAFGALALVLALLAKYSALTSMEPSRLDAAIVSAQILGRWTFLPMGYFNRWAREGLAAEFMKGLSFKAVAAGTALAVVPVVLLARIHGAVAMAAAIVLMAVLSVYFKRRIGGVTGDCFGATFQLVEVATYAVFLS